jgi:hypothetical protein
MVLSSSKYPHFHPYLHFGKTVAILVRLQKQGYRKKLSFLDFASMQTLCPELTGVEENAPEDFSGAVSWCVQEFQRRYKPQQEQEDLEGGMGSGDNSPRSCILVTHEEGIRGMIENIGKLPFCAMAKFKAEPLEGGSAQEYGGEGFPSMVVDSSRFRLLSLNDRDGTPIPFPANEKKGAQDEVQQGP